jgi:hypothetical protein
MAVGVASGDNRENDAAHTGSALGDLWRALSLGILQAVRDAVRDALNPAVGPSMALRKLRRRTATLFGEARQRSTPILSEQLTRAVANLDAELRHDFPAQPPKPTPPPVVQHIVQVLVRQLDHVQVQAQRSTEDAFKKAIGSVMTPRPGITQAQRWENAQKVLDDLADKGITGFTDKTGRHWELTSYVEMATRTAVSRSLLNIQLTAFTGLGHDAVLVISRTLDAPCPMCRPYEGKVLSLTGKTVGQDVTVTPYDMPERTERVIATLPEAMAKGLLHPNCRHSILPYADGQSMTPAGLEPKPAAEYAAEQRQRALERKVREHRRRAAVALPGQKASAKRRLAASVKASRDHAAHHGVKRRTRRERLGVPR